MKNLKIFVYFLKLIRWQNILIVMATMFLMRYSIIKPLLKFNGFDLQLSTLHFILLVLSTSLITAAGYIINDYFDRKTDLVNKPYKVIIGRFIKRRAAMTLHMLFNGLALLIGAYISYKNNIDFLLTIFILAAGLLWFYSTHYKRQVLTGNLIVALLASMIPMLVIFFELPLLNKAYKVSLLAANTNFKYIFIWVSGFAYFAFITNLLREIVKDIEDLEGDQAYGRNSLIMLVGLNWTKAIIIFLFSIIILSIVLALYFFIPDVYSKFYLGILIIVPCLISIYLTAISANKWHYSRISTLIKVMMVAGVFYSLLVDFIIKQTFA